MEIRDESLSPFFIKSSGESFDLYQEKVKESGSDIGSTYETVIGYFSTPSSALKKAAALRASMGKEVCDLNAFIERIESIAFGLSAKYQETK